MALPSVKEEWLEPLLKDFGFKRSRIATGCKRSRFAACQASCVSVLYLLYLCPMPTRISCPIYDIHSISDMPSSVIYKLLPLWVKWTCKIFVPGSVGTSMFSPLLTSSAPSNCHQLLHTATYSLDYLCLVFRHCYQIGKYPKQIQTPALVALYRAQSPSSGTCRPDLRVHWPSSTSSYFDGYCCAQRDDNSA